MPGWKINCLKSDDGLNPSDPIEQSKQLELTPPSDEQQNPGKFSIFFSRLNY